MTDQQQPEQPRQARVIVNPDPGGDPRLVAVHIDEHVFVWPRAFARAVADDILSVCPQEA